MRDLHIPTADEVKALSRDQQVKVAAVGIFAAFVFSEHRVLAGLAGAALMLLVVTNAEACCADCAGTTTSPPIVPPRGDGLDEGAASAMYYAGRPTSQGGESPDIINRTSVSIGLDEGGCNGGCQ